MPDSSISKFFEKSRKDRLDIVGKFANLSDEELDIYLEDHKLPNEFKYFDPTKVLSNRECGLHA